MFYRPEKGHGLAHNPFNAIITPRPIGWISTQSKDGVANLAPYSFFNGIAYEPPQVMFASTDAKDSLRNIEETGVFCVNIVESAARDRMNASSKAYPHGTDEFEASGTPKALCETIDCVRVQDSPASLECQMTQIIKTLGENNYLIMGEVMGVHMRDNCINDGIFDVTTYGPLSRLGYRDYAVVSDPFTLTRPDD